jgi:hypothetical protein
MTDETPSQDRHFQRRQKAAIAGLHLPTDEELLRGMAFFREDMAEDIREYSTRLSGRVKKRKQTGLLSTSSMRPKACRSKSAACDAGSIGPSLGTAKQQL